MEAEERRARHEAEQDEKRMKHEAEQDEKREQLFLSILCKLWPGRPVDTESNDWSLILSPQTFLFYKNDFHRLLLYYVK